MIRLKFENFKKKKLLKCSAESACCIKAIPGMRRADISTLEAERNKNSNQSCVGSALKA